MPNSFATPSCVNIRNVSGRFDFWDCASFNFAGPTSSPTMKASVFPLMLLVTFAPSSLSRDFKESLYMDSPEITHVLLVKLKPDNK